MTDHPDTRDLNERAADKALGADWPVKKGMTPEAQRIAIAEACGWRQRTEGLMWHDDKHRAAIVQGSALEEVRRKMRLPMDNGVMLPDYLSDLNAMHEAEKLLTSRQRTLFEVEVLRLTTGKEAFDYDRGDLIAVITATAAQRAEAFLRTIGKWAP